MSWRSIEQRARIRRHGTVEARGFSLLRMRPAVALGPHGREFRNSIIGQDLHATFDRHNEPYSKLWAGGIP
jgi:hypothetical protein